MAKRIRTESILNAIDNKIPNEVFCVFFVLVVLCLLGDDNIIEMLKENTYLQMTAVGIFLFLIFYRVPWSVAFVIVFMFCLFFSNMGFRVHSSISRVKTKIPKGYIWLQDVFERSKRLFQKESVKVKPILKKPEDKSTTNVKHAKSGKKKAVRFKLDEDSEIRKDEEIEKDSGFESDTLSETSDLRSERDLGNLVDQYIK